jgi:hypothetical protein
MGELGRDWFRGVGVTVPVTGGHCTMTLNRGPNRRKGLTSTRCRYQAAAARAVYGHKRRLTASARSGPGCPLCSFGPHMGRDFLDSSWVSICTTFPQPNTRSRWVGEPAAAAFLSFALRSTFYCTGHAAAILMFAGVANVLPWVVPCPPQAAPTLRTGASTLRAFLAVDAVDTLRWQPRLQLGTRTAGCIEPLHSVRMRKCFCREAACERLRTLAKGEVGECWSATPNHYPSCCAFALASARRRRAVSPIPSSCVPPCHLVLKLHAPYIALSVPPGVHCAPCSLPRNTLKIRGHPCCILNLCALPHRPRPCQHRHLLRRAQERTGNRC